MAALSMTNPMKPKAKYLAFSADEFSSIKCNAYAMSAQTPKSTNILTMYMGV